LFIQKYFQHSLEVIGIQQATLFPCLLNPRLLIVESWFLGLFRNHEKSMTAVIPRSFKQFTIWIVLAFRMYC
jgi:hypothetical protein